MNFITLKIMENNINSHYKQKDKIDVIEMFKLSFPKNEVRSALLFNVIKYNERVGKKKSIAQSVVSKVLTILSETKSISDLEFEQLSESFNVVVEHFDELQRLDDIKKRNHYTQFIKELDSE